MAFAAASKRLHGLTANRSEFLGRMGSYSRPAAMTLIGLSGEVQPGCDPCAALQVHIELPAGGGEEVSAAFTSARVATGSTAGPDDGASDAIAGSAAVVGATKPSAGPHAVFTNLVGSAGAREGEAATCQS